MNIKSILCCIVLSALMPSCQKESANSIVGKWTSQKYEIYDNGHLSITETLNEDYLFSDDGKVYTPDGVFNYSLSRKGITIDSALYEIYKHTSRELILIDEYKPEEENRIITTWLFFIRVE